jgi:multidrug efflux pump subunit AcrB
MISRFFIDRPIFAVVISILITLAGVLAIKNLPIAQYPQITPPSVGVSAVYAGASAETVASAVAAPLEQQINGAEGMTYMTSNNSATGTMSLSASFEIGTDIDKVATDIQNRVNLALPQLPGVVRQGGVMVQKSTSNILMVIAVQSPDGRYDSIYTSNYASLNILDELKRVPWARATMRCACGSSPTAWRSWASPATTSLPQCARRMPRSPSGRSVHRRTRRPWN